MSKGAELITKERERHPEEGWTADHDARHVMGQLIDAAHCYLTAFNQNAARPSGWPWSKQDWKPEDRIRNLVKAGSLVAAEIDRLIAEKEVSIEDSSHS